MNRKAWIELRGWTCLLPALWLGFSTLGRTEEAKSPWESSIAAFEAADRKTPPPANPVLFVGSSTIRMWNIEKSFPGLVALNRGFGGSNFADLISFFDRIVLPYKPRIVVVYSGDNDIASGKTPEQVARDYDEFHKKFRMAYPETPVIFLAIKPSLARWELYDKMRAANRLIIEAHASDPKFSALDLGPALLGADGKPIADLFVKDGLHLSQKGYAIWSAEVSRALEDLGKMAP